MDINWALVAGIAVAAVAHIVALYLVIEAAVGHALERTQKR